MGAAGGGERLGGGTGSAEGDGGRPGAGTLHVAATPIGHLGDASPRLKETLARCALVLCEDTRRTGRLLAHLGVEAKLLTCHEHDEDRRVGAVLARLRAGDDVALVSDAGTPCLSDPGLRLVAAAHAAGIRVSPVPGPSAITAALSAAGLPGGRFAFEGFLPRRATARRKHLAALAAEPRTLVLLEAPHRLAAALADLAEILGPGRKAVLAREISKLHEEIAAATLGELAARYAAEVPRGEVTLVVAGAPAEPAPAVTAPDDIRRRLARLEAAGVPRREALREVARESGLGRRAVYRLARIERRGAGEEE